MLFCQTIQGQHNVEYPESTTQTQWFSWKAKRSFIYSTLWGDFYIYLSVPSLHMNLMSLCSYTSLAEHNKDINQHLMIGLQADSRLTHKELYYVYALENTMSPCSGACGNVLLIFTLSVLKNGHSERFKVLCPDTVDSALGRHSNWTVFAVPVVIYCGIMLCTF